MQTPVGEEYGAAGKPRGDSVASSARTVRRTVVVLLISAGMVLSSLSPATPAVLGGFEEGALQREPLTTPESLADGLVEGLQFADPEAGLAGIAPPEATSGGGAQLSYPLVVPAGRGLTPEVTLQYDSGGASSWAGYGWDLSVGDVSVDTTFGAPLFCPRATKPTCGNYESETYRLNGDLLAPSAVRTDLLPRVAERADFTRKVETEYEHVIRHGDSPKNYSWEVRDKSGNVSWYGAFPDAGGPFGGPGTRTGAVRNDETRDPSSILSDGEGNAFRWYLKAQRDVGVNVIRYEYETVYYKAVDTTEGLGWQKVTAEGCTGVCGKHVYLSKILYTGGAEASGDEESPAYEISFLRNKQRPDPVIDGRGGFLDVDVEQLTAVMVTFTKPGGQPQKVVEYDVDTTTGQFGKTMLTAVHQTGCATGDTCTPTTRATHTFTYHDDVQGKGFADAATWDTRDDDLDRGRLEGKAGALGMSETNAGDGHVYLGFNPTMPTKLGSFGGSLTFDGAETKSLSEFMDINGDGLPDKVFREGTKIKYRLNTSKPGDPLDARITFEESAREISGLDTLPGEAQFGLAGGIEAFFGIAAMFNAGGSWNWSKGYFSDVNGDGLPDWVNNTTVLFNHLRCDGEPEVCRPTFDSSDGATRAPLNVRAVQGAADEALRQTTELLRRLSPPVDTLRRWVAPYAGVVRIRSSARFGGTEAADCSGTDGVLVALQHNGEELARCVLTAEGQSWDVDRTRTVAKGDAIYFRLGADPDLPWSTVEWSPTVTYTSFQHGRPAAEVVADENGLSQTVYDSRADFDLAGRPNGYVGVPDAGTLRYTGVVEKQVTTDYVRPTIRHYRGAAPDTLVDERVRVTAVDGAGNPDSTRQKQVERQTIAGVDRWCVVYPGGGTPLACFDSQSAAEAHLQVLFPSETGRFRTEARFPVDAPVTDANGAQTAQDRVEFLLAADSPVAATALRWVEVPEMCYLDGATCKAGGTRINPPVDTDIYPLHSNIAPRVGYTAAASGERTVRIQFDIVRNIFDDFPGGTAFVTVKGSDASLFRYPLTVPRNGIGHYDDQNLRVTLKQGVRYWFDVSVREPSLYEVMRNGKVELSAGRDSNGNIIWEDVTNPHSSFNGTGRQGYFGLGYRGWAVAGYLGSGDRRTSAIHESDLRIPTFKSKGEACQALTGGACRTSNEGVGFPGQYSDDYGPSGPAFDAASVESQIKKAYAFIPKRTTDPSTRKVGEVWEGPREKIDATATAVRAARLGGHVPSLAASTGSIAPPTLKGQVSPSLSITGGVGPLTASFGVGWSDGDVDYLDMNGDGFPDVVRSDSIEYTDPRGGHACLQAGGVLVSCAGGGVGAVNEEITLGLSGGLSGSPVAVKGNARGKTNANNGGAAAKGGSTSKDQYSASVGAGIEAAGSWTSPVAKAPGWDEDGHGVKPRWDANDFSAVPGDPMGSSGTELQRMIADVNGDGLPDQVKTKTEGVYVKLNLGYGFAPDWVLWTPDSGFESAESGSGATAVGIGFSGFFKDFSGGVSRNASVDFPRYAWEDVNGDGILDALYKSSNDVRVAFGTGSGVMQGQKYGDTGAVKFDVLGDIGVSLGDQVRQQSGVGWGGGADFTIAIGPLCVAACYLIVNPGAHYENSLSITDVDLQDVNGDGYADSVNRVADAGNKEKLQVRLNRQGRTGLLKTVRNPLGGTMELDYERKGNTLDHPDSTWVMSSVSLDDGRSGDGPDTTRTTFEYAGLRYDFVNREDLGFATVTARELGADGPLRASRRTFSNDNLFAAGLQTSVELFDGDVHPDNLLQRSTADWKVLEGTTQRALDVASLSADALLTAWATPLLSGLREEWYEKGPASPNRATATTYEYDRLGNPTRIRDHGDPSVAADDVVAEVVYSNCGNAASDGLDDRCGTAAGPSTHQPAFWHNQLCPTWVSLPAVVTFKDGAGNVLRHRDGKQDLCDNSTVTLLRELIEGEPGSGEHAETRLAYDAFGSYDRIVYPLGENGRHYAVHYEYDPDRNSDVAQVTEYDLTEDEAARFLEHGPGQPEGVPSAASTGLTTRATYNGRAGQVATRTDANGDTTSYEYDALGRLARLRTPDGGTITYGYAPTGASYAHATAHHSDEFNPGNTIDTVTFVDGVGRVTQQKQETSVFQGVGQPELNGFYVSGALEFDALGRVVDEALPTFEPMGSATTFKPRPPAQPSTRNRYDKLDRLRHQTLPDSRVTTTEYRFVADMGITLSAQEVTDPMGRRTTTYTDVRGYARAIDDTALGKDALRTSYLHDVLGQLRSVTSAGREQVRHTYDLLGRRTSTRTEDAGRVTYGYDPAGNQVSKQSSVQRDDNNSQTRYRYSFGNLVEIDYPDATPDVTLRWGGYDGAPTTDHGAGRLVGIEDAGRRQTLGYDENGMVDAETTEMVGDAWKMGRLRTTWDHDWLGRTGRTTYPDRETVTQGFDLGGQLASVSGQKACNELGRLAAAIDATETTIGVQEFPTLGPPAVPFTITVEGEQMRVTDRIPGAAPDLYTYTVERGVNGTAEAPTATGHAAGTKVVADAELTCTYRYLDSQQYDLFGAPTFQQFGNGNRTQYERDPLNRRLNRQVTTAPRQRPTSVGSLASAVDASATTLTVAELYAPPVLPFLATIGIEQVRVTGRAPTGDEGVFTWTVERGAGGTSAAAQAERTTVLVDRVQQNLTYSYDPVGNVAGYVNDLPPDVPSLFGGKDTQTYTYDGYYRLTGSGGTWNEAQNTRYYDYAVTYDDATGNLASKRQKVWEIKVGCRRNCEDVIPETTYEFTDVAYSEAHQHRLTTQGGESFTYDRDGNITKIESEDNLREMAWNAEGKMTMIVDRPNGTGGKPTFLTYDHKGELAIEEKEQGRTWFVNPWVTVKDGTVWKNVFAGDERLGAKFSQDGYEQKVYFLHKDLQGSTNVATDRVAGIFQHQEYLPAGEPWIKEDSTVYRTPYQFSGEYFDEDHDLADFGQRWYEPAGQFFYSADPAVTEEVSSVLEEPRLQSVYALGFGNAVSHVDPDGRKPFHLSADQRLQLLNDLRAAGVKVKRHPGLLGDIDTFFDKHQGVRGRTAFAVLNRYGKLAKLQEFADKLDQKPLVEFELAKGSSKLKSVNLSFGMGAQKKFAVGSAAPAASQASAAAGPAPPNAPAANAPAAAPPPPPPPPPQSWKPGVKPGGSVSNGNAAGTSSVSGGAPSRSDGGQ